MIQTGQGRIILMSSQKVQHKNRDIIDIGLLRSTAITSNHVYYICVPHLKKMASIGKISNICICYLFSHPFHITNDSSLQAIVNLFREHRDVTDTSKNVIDFSILKEHGVDINLIYEDVETISNNSNLCTRYARQHFITNSIPLKVWISENNVKYHVSKTVMVYIDPAPVVSETSFNAICFVTRVNSSSIENNSYRYVVIGLENFKSDKYDPNTQNYQVANANILMKDINAICEIYEGYFDTFVIAPEADSIGMEQFGLHCKMLLQNYPKLKAQNGPKMYFTTIKQQQERAANNNEMTDTVQTTSQQSMKRGKKRKHSIEIPLLLNDETLQTQDEKYRIGYNLGRHKINTYLDFILKEYNSLNISCAFEIFGYSLCSENISIPTLIADGLDNLTLKEKYLNGKKILQISGKKQVNGRFIKDDIPDAFINSIALFPAAVGEVSILNPFYELKA